MSIWDQVDMTYRADRDASRAPYAFVVVNDIRRFRHCPGPPVMEVLLIIWEPGVEIKERAFNYAPGSANCKNTPLIGARLGGRY